MDTIDMSPIEGNRPTSPLQVYLYLFVPTGRYVVPTSRVIATISIKVPTGRNIVPAGYIVPTGLKDLSRAETYKWYQSLERVSVEE
ncbi:hypothetical protein Tco_0928419 [Tanacetum coccineum]